MSKSQQDKMDCIIFSNISYLLLKHYNKKYGGEKFKYLSIKKNSWGNEEGEFHQFITFKYKNIWYYLDRFECGILIHGEKEKNLKKIGLTEFSEIGLVMYRLECGYKNPQDAQDKISAIVNNHLFKLTNLHY